MIKLFVLVGFAIILVVIWIWSARNADSESILNHDIHKSVEENNQLTSTISLLKKENADLRAIKYADDNIFQFIRCINIPQYPICSPTDPNTDPTKGSDPGSGGVACRSKQINCNWFKLVLENDPVAVERMKQATDKYYQTGKPHNLSELTNPIKNVSWFF